MGLKSSRVQGYRASAAVLSVPAAEKQTAALSKSWNDLKLTILALVYLTLNTT